MITIGFYNQKGGVGKTSSCIHLAAIFSDFGYKTAVADMDGQINATQFLLSDNENFFINGQYREDVYNIENLIEQNCSPLNCITYKTFSRHAHFKKLEYSLGVIPGTSNINYLNFEDMFCLRKSFGTIKDEFDYLFVDLSPSDNTAVAVALAACDYVICPSEAELDSVNGFKKLLDLVDDLNVNYNTDIKVLGLFVNKFVQVRSFQKAIKEQLELFDPKYIFKTYIPNDARVPEARGLLTPLEYCARSCDANKAFRKLAKEILDKIERKGE